MNTTILTQASCHALDLGFLTWFDWRLDVFCFYYVMLVEFERELLCILTHLCITALDLELFTHRDRKMEVCCDKCSQQLAKTLLQGLHLVLAYPVCIKYCFFEPF